MKGLVLRMLEIVPMPLTVQEEFERYLAPVPRDDPEIRQRGRNLTEMMLRHYPEVREELIEKGIEQGLTPLAHQFERRLGRALTAEEHHALRERFDRLGSNRLGDVVLDLSAAALAGWLADPDAAQRRKVEAAIDAVRAKLGKSSIGKGRGIEIKRR